jgi:hypothetical protein
MAVIVITSRVLKMDNGSNSESKTQSRITLIHVTIHYFVSEMAKTYIQKRTNKKLGEYKNEI